MTLFHPSTGLVRVRGSVSTKNEVLHRGLKEELTAILEELPAAEGVLSPAANRAQWEGWHQGLTRRITRPDKLPRLRMLLVMDNRTGHRTPSVMLWLFERGIMPLFTPLGGSWLTMAKSIQRILKRRGLEGHHPPTPEQIIDWLEAAARGWNNDPTPFEWGGRRAARRRRSRARRHSVGGSCAFIRRPIRRSRTALAQRHPAMQTTH